jgi:pilus assembly protein Flp/PilA
MANELADGQAFCAFRGESVCTAIEYGLIAGLIALVIIAAVTVVGTSLSAKFNAVATNLS